MVRWWIVCGRVKQKFLFFYFLHRHFPWWSNEALSMLLSHTQNPSTDELFRMNQNDLVIFLSIMSIIITNTHRFDGHGSIKRQTYTHTNYGILSTLTGQLPIYTFVVKWDFALGNDFGANTKTSHYYRHSSLLWFPIKIFLSLRLYFSVCCREVTCFILLNNIHAFGIIKDLYWNGIFIIKPWANI